MDKQYLDTLGYTYTNLSSGYVGINYDALTGADEGFISEVLSALEPVISNENLIDIIIGMDNHQIPTGRTELSVQKTSTAQLPDVLNAGSDDAAILIEKRAKDVGIYEIDYIWYKYLHGNDLQKKSKSGTQRARDFADKMSNFVFSGTIQPALLQDIAQSFRKIATIDNIDIRLYKTFPLKDSSNLYLYDRHGLRMEKEFTKGKLLSQREYKDETVTETTFNDNLPVRIQTSRTGLHGIKEIITEIPSYEHGILTKSKVTYAQRLTEGFRPVCFVHKMYHEGRLLSSKIIDSRYGKKTYTFSNNGFHMEEAGNEIEFNGRIEFPENIDSMDALKQLNMLEGGLMQLKTRLPEYKTDYGRILNTIYTEKTNYAISAIKENSAIIYVADRGNTTIYDTRFKKAVYFPVSVVKKFLPVYKNYPNVIVEQRIKEGNDHAAIRRLYELGTRVEDEETIYAFRRVIKALSRNPFTPVDILKDIVTRIYEGRFESDNIRFIAENPSADEKTLQEILNHNPSILVRSSIEAHPNRPKQIKKQVTKAEARKAADTILNNG